MAATAHRRRLRKHCLGFGQTELLFQNTDGPPQECDVKLTLHYFRNPPTAGGFRYGSPWLVYAVLVARDRRRR
jgi:hypothetical protein